MRAGGAGGVVVGFSQIEAIVHGVHAGLVALGCGLVSVWLARWVFVNKEQRRLGRRQNWHETLPLTLISMLITGVIVHDRALGLSAAVFTGLGVGWAAVLVLDILGQRTIAALQAMLGSVPAVIIPPQADLSGHDGRVDNEVADTPAEMAKLIDHIDEHDKRRP